MPLRPGWSATTLLLGSMLSLPLPSAATQTISPEVIAERQRWDVLDGDWEGVLVETWQANNRVDVRAQIKGLTITVFVRRSPAEVWVRMGEKTKPTLSKTDYVVFIDSVIPTFPGRHLLVFHRRDDHSGDAIFAREVETAPKTYSQTDLRSGTLRRQSPAARR